MPKVEGSHDVVRFEDFELDLRTGELRHTDGKIIRLPEQPFQILLALLERPNEIVSREEIRKRLWRNDTVVEFEHSISAAMNRLRQALRDSGDDPRYIETLARRGYRWRIAVQWVESSLERKSPAPPATASGDATGTKVSTVLAREREHEVRLVSNASRPAELEARLTGRRIKRRIGVVLCLTAAVLLITLLSSGPTKVRHWLPSLTGTPEIRSIAVLPLKNLSGDPQQEYFAQGMTEELITDLSQIRALKVISRTSSEVYQDTHKPLPQIARELNVDAIVEGSVQRLDGQVRITAQLIYAPEDRNVWAQTYERNAQSALTLQSDVAAAIADQVEQTLSHRQTLARRINASAANPEAYDLYLKGRYYWNQRTPTGFWMGIESFRRAIQKDPTYARAYAGLADSYVLLGPTDALPAKEVYPLARAAAMKALQFDDTLAEAHASLGFVTLLYDWNPAQAEKEFRRAIELDPNYPTAHHWYAYDLAAMKRSDEAVAEIRRALDLDPLSPIINTDLSQILFFARRADEAIVQCQKTIGLDPQFNQVYWYLGLLYEQKGMFDRALDAFLKSIPGPTDSEQDNAIRAAYRISGIKAYWTARLAMLKQQSKEHYVSPFTFAVVYARIGQRDTALGDLEKALDERYPSMVFIPVEPVFDDLRPNPRFQVLLQRIGL